MIMAPCAANAPQGPAVNLVEADGYIERRNHQDEPPPILQHGFVIAKKLQQRPGKEDQHQGQQRGNRQGHGQRRRTPCRARASFFAPQFCPTKVVEARAMLCTGIRIKASSLL